jgi:hypothetical protein
MLGLPRCEPFTNQTRVQLRKAVVAEDKQVDVVVFVFNLLFSFCVVVVVKCIDFITLSEGKTQQLVLERLVFERRLFALYTRK